MDQFYLLSIKSCFRFRRFSRKLAWRIEHLPALLIAALVASSGLEKAAAIGFEGDFAGWNFICTDMLNFYCGYIVEGDSSRATVNAPTLDDEAPGPPNPSTLGTTIWQLRPSSDYTIEFDLEFVARTDETKAMEATAFYQVGSTRTDISSFGIYNNISPISISAGQTLSFGIDIISYNTGYILNGTDMQLEISSFTATPVTAPVIPAPLPAIGAASLFLGSRRLRRRIRRKTFLEASEPLFGPPVLRCNRQNLGR